MSLIRKAFVAGTKRWGAPAAKQRVWDSEYRTGRWTYDRWGTNNERSDPIYGFLERYSAGGTILDLGCGSGKTALEMKPDFLRYVGVDISRQAVEEARTAFNTEPERSEKVQFIAEDIFSFVPREKYSVILFRESIYYIPFHRIKPMLLRYGNCLAPGGVFVIRLHDPHRYRKIIKLLEETFVLNEHYVPNDSTVAIIVCSGHRNF